jgi:ribosomal RNA-processing protein 12
MASFATALSNVRRLSSSNLAHQAKPAQLLGAIEQTISSQLSSSSTSTPTLPHSATAYFASLLQCLEKACADELPGQDDEAMAESENMGQGALIPALLYLLAIVVPETPTQVVLSKVSPLLECCLPLFDSALEHPPALRSLLQITTSVITAAPAGLLMSSPLLKKAWNYLLELNLDPRPKVRHIAQEGVRKVLTTPIPPKVTAGSHPYLPRAREWSMRILQDEANGAGAGASKKKARFAEEGEQEGKKAIWVVQGLRGWVAVWGDEVSHG